MPPRTKKIKTEKPPSPPEPEAPPRVYSCDECQRIHDDQGRGAFVATRCRECGLAVWFNSTREAMAYTRTLADYCEGCNKAPCQGDCEEEN